MTGFDVTAVDVQVTGRSLRQISADARDQLTTLTGDVDSLLGGSWSGAAAAQFRAGWDAWHAAAADALTVLGQLGDLLGETAQNYTASDVGGSDGLSRAGQGA